MQKTRPLLQFLVKYASLSKLKRFLYLFSILVV